MFINLSRRSAITVLFVALASSIPRASPRQLEKNKAPEFTYKVIHTYPHDASAFTQGLLYHDSFLYEGTGLKGRSSLRKVRLETGEVLQRAELAPDYFGEGVTIFKNQIIQLTWQSHIGFVYSLADFRLLRQFSYPGEGWGVTTDGRELFMSDGTAEIRVWEPATFAEKRRITVHEGSRHSDELNELEFVASPRKPGKSSAGST
jgi:glutaminyl-peptide cyclotransferase